MQAQRHVYVVRVIGLRRLIGEVSGVLSLERSVIRKTNNAIHLIDLLDVHSTSGML